MQWVQWPCNDMSPTPACAFDNQWGMECADGVTGCLAIVLVWRVVAESMVVVLSMAASVAQRWFPAMSEEQALDATDMDDGGRPVFPSRSKR